jgi:DNA invertase Pin-like site-specific DNA recombinase
VQCLFAASERQRDGAGKLRRTHREGEKFSGKVEGIANAKARGVYRGREAIIDPAKIKKMKADGVGASAIPKALEISRASVYRAG